jgi:hypothetical protein
MEDYSKKRLYKKIIVKLLRERKLTVDEIMVSLNNILNNEYGFEPISRRTFDRAKESLIENGYQINSRKFNVRNYFVLEGYPDNLNLTQEEQLTFPLLIGLLDTEKTMNSVEWLKLTLMDEFGYSKEDLNPFPYFLHIQPTLNSQDKLLIMAGKIIEYIKKGQAIKFLYNKKGVEGMRQVAPLQIRYYDNRYYLFGSAIDEETYEPTNLLQTYNMDKFVGIEVMPAIKETEEVLEEDILIFYDYDSLYKTTRLEELLKHSLGVWYDWKNNQLKTYRLKFTDWAMGIMENKKIHPSQVVKEKKSDFLIVEITVWDNHEIDYFLGRFGDKCERLN